MKQTNKIMVNKYSWDKVEENKYHVWHFEPETQTFICITDTSEKAHFLATAANQFSYESKEAIEFARWKDKNVRTAQKGRTHTQWYKGKKYTYAALYKLFIEAWERKEP